MHCFLILALLFLLSSLYQQQLLGLAWLKGEAVIESIGNCISYVSHFRHAFLHTRTFTETQPQTHTDSQTHIQKQT